MDQEHNVPTLQAAGPYLDPIQQLVDDDEDALQRELALPSPEELVYPSLVMVPYWEYVRIS